VVHAVCREGTRWVDMLTRLLTAGGEGRGATSNLEDVNNRVMGDCLYPQRLAAIPVLSYIESTAAVLKQPLNPVTSKSSPTERYCAALGSAFSEHANVAWMGRVKFAFLG